MTFYQIPTGIRYGETGLPELPLALVLHHGNDDFFNGAVGKGEEHEDLHNVEGGVCLGAGGCGTADASMGALFGGNVHPTSIGHLLTEATRGIAHPSMIQGEAFVIAIQQQTVAMLGGDHRVGPRLLFGRRGGTGEKKT